MDRNTQLSEIEQYIAKYGVTKGPVAFVCTTIQAEIPTRVFVHSQVKPKTNIYARSSKKSKK